MIVCLCRGKSDRDISRAIENGATSVADLQRCGIGTDCGSCHGVLRMMLAEAVAADAAVAAACPQCATAAETPAVASA